MSMLLDRPSIVNPTFDDYRPGPAPYAPTSADNAYRIGFDLGLDREPADAPGHLPADDARMFDAGWRAGAAEWDLRLDAMYADRVADGEIRETDLYPAGSWS